MRQSRGKEKGEERGGGGEERRRWKRMRRRRQEQEVEVEEEVEVEVEVEVEAESVGGTADTLPVITPLATCNTCNTPKPTLWSLAMYKWTI